LIRPNATAVLWPVRTWLRSPIGVLVVLAAVTGIVLRIWTYRSLMGTPNADEAVVGLMARHAEHGHLTTFFWGQDYGGPQEAWLTVPLFWVFGPSWFCLRLILVLLTAASAVAVWRVGLRTIGDPGATVAAALLWVWPPFAVFELLHQQGFYASDVLYCALLLLLALRLVERPDRVRVVTFSLVLGLALWESVQLVTVAVGVVAWILWKAREHYVKSAQLQLPSSWAPRLGSCGSRRTDPRLSRKDEVACLCAAFASSHRRTCR
jgi:hypothetical protein